MKGYEVGVQISGLIPELQPYCRALVDAAGAAGLQPRLTSTFRTHAEQTRLYRRFLAGTQQLPVAPPGSSAHEFGFAFDMVVAPMDALADVGAYWQDLGGVWGGAFNDPVHFEYPGFKQAYVPDSSSDRGVIETVQAWSKSALDWFNDNVPWYVQMILPAGFYAQEIKTPRQMSDAIARTGLF